MTRGGGGGKAPADADGPVFLTETPSPITFFTTVFIFLHSKKNFVHRDLYMDFPDYQSNTGM